MSKMNGRSTRICLVDGEASGSLTAEVMNWSGKMLVALLTKLAELANGRRLLGPKSMFWRDQIPTI